jgi:very-short-patch-repair endonuclease
MSDPPPDVRTARARPLRRDQTDAERKLWRLISNRQLGGFKFRRQYPIDRYFVDFACREASLIVEIDGGQHAINVDYDAERTEVLAHAG